MSGKRRRSREIVDEDDCQYLVGGKHPTVLEDDEVESAHERLNRRNLAEH